MLPVPVHVDALEDGAVQLRRGPGDRDAVLRARRDRHLAQLRQRAKVPQQRFLHLLHVAPSPAWVRRMGNQGGPVKGRDRVGTIDQVRSGMPGPMHYYVFCNTIQLLGDGVAVDVDGDDGAFADVGGQEQARKVHQVQVRRQQRRHTGLEGRHRELHHARPALG